VCGKEQINLFFFQTQIKVSGHFVNGIRLKPLTEMFSVVFDGSVSCTHTHCKNEYALSNQ